MYKNKTEVGQLTLVKRESCVDTKTNKTLSFSMSGYMSATVAQMSVRGLHGNAQPMTLGGSQPALHSSVIKTQPHMWRLSYTRGSLKE